MYHLASLLQPQALWRWQFEGIPIFKIFAGVSLLSAAMRIFQNQVSFDIYKSRFTIAILLLFALLHIGNITSPFESKALAHAINQVLATLNTIVIMYFTTLALLQKEQHIINLSWALIIAACYYTYWGNIAYIEQDWSKFYQGRLAGIYRSQYADANLLAVMLVMAYPFMMLTALRQNSAIKKIVLMGFILLLWHTIFLIGSRGSLLGLGACTLFLAHIVKSKKFKITIALALVGALITQGGIIMSRSQETEASSDEPINPRIASWGVGMDLAWEYPLTGVGVRKFVTASDALYPGRSPHVAHNTLIGLSAESGLPAGAAFILLLLTARRSYRYTQRNEQIISSNMLYINNASGASILGFAVCSIFLDLTIFEPFYFMIIIIQAKDFIVRQQIKDQLQATI